MLNTQCVCTCVSVSGCVPDTHTHTHMQVNQEVAANKPNKPTAAPEVQQCDDETDLAVEYMEV